MGDYYEAEIERLHGLLASIYRRGTLTPEEKLKVEGLWARIERLESEHVKEIARGRRG